MCHGWMHVLGDTMLSSMALAFESSVKSGMHKVNLRPPDGIDESRTFMVLLEDRNRLAYGGTCSDSTACATQTM
jgi:hypothetical protein